MQLTRSLMDYRFSWTKNKMNQSVSDSQKTRKNSMPYYNVQQFQPNQSVGNNNNNNNKSLSYPNFGNTPQQQITSNLSNFQRSASREKLNQFTLMQQQHHIQFNQPQIPQQNSANTAYHRNSLNSLMPFSLQQQQQFANRRNSCGVNSSMSSLIDSNEQGMSISPNMLNSMSTSLTPKVTTTSDINSRLESLCRQMTEQAIN